MALVINCMILNIKSIFTRCETG